MRKAATDLSSRNIKGGVRSRKRGNPSFTKVPPLNGGDARSKYKSRVEKKQEREEDGRGLQRCRIGKKGSKNRPISKGEMGNKPERVVPFGVVVEFLVAKLPFLPPPFSFSFFSHSPGRWPRGNRRDAIVLSTSHIFFFSFLSPPFHLYFEPPPPLTMQFTRR